MVDCRTLITLILSSVYKSTALQSLRRAMKLLKNLRQGIAYQMKGYQMKESQRLWGEAQGPAVTEIMRKTNSR